MTSKTFGVAPSQGAFALGENGDISRPDHDRIMLWLDAKIRGGWLAQNYLPFTVDADRASAITRADFYSEAATRLPEEQLLAAYDAAEDPPIDRAITVQSVTWEMPVGAPRPIGFIDLAVTFYRRRIGCQFRLDSPHFGHPRQLTAKKSAEYEHTELGFEVKTEKASLGETIRQIRAMQQVGGHSRRWFVVRRANEQWERTLTGQGIGFLPYEP